jgi:O-antigen ligase/polysaccharide polymerase Wzy-like membrane protein
MMRVADPGPFALAALILWIPISLAFFFTMKKERAALMTVFGGLLFLPEVAAFRPPMLPALTKQTIPYLCVILGYTLRGPARMWRLPREKWVLWVSMVGLFNGIAIALSNQDPLTYGTWRVVTLPGLGIKDGMYETVNGFVNSAVPFFVGAVVIRGREDVEDLLAFVAAAGLIYAPFALLEVRLSPQLHHWIYGYHQHPDFSQTLRFGGYRPMVFMAHGLAVGLWFMVCLLAAAALKRTRHRLFGLKPGTAALLLAITLLVCKSTGAVIYAVFGLPLVMWASAKAQLRVAALLAAIVFIYPLLREADLVPVKPMLEAAAEIDQDRAGSLGFRFENEAALLKKAAQRPWFGWGTYDRNAIFDGGGSVVSVTDGEWIIALGISGAVGFASSFALLVFPIVLARRRLKNIDDLLERRLVASLSLIVAFTALDLIPNGLFSSYPYFLSGALLAATSAPRVRTRYTAAPMPLT